jgi:predicted ATPase
LRLLRDALAVTHSRGVRLWEAELYRLQGELLPARSKAQPAEAEACFRRALDVARGHAAKSFELRAVMSLSRLWQQQGRREKAHQLLAPIYAWFTEGFDTADLQEGRALLEGIRRKFSFVGPAEV